MNADLLARIGRGLFKLLPARNELLYRCCRFVVNRYEGDNDEEMTRNGELRVMERYLPAAAVVFDVGANVGEWTARALSLNQAAAYHLFEPSPATFAKLRSHGFPTNVTLNNCGLGDEPGQRTLFVFGEALGANSLYDRVGTDAVTRRQEHVEMSTIDDYCAARSIDWIDFLKLDIEGHELFAFRGARRMLAEGRIGVIQFEYGGTYIDAGVLLKDVWAYIADVNPGYTIGKVHSAGVMPCPTYRQSLETFKYSNWLIVRTDKTEQV